jgi:hypothetical protein
MINGFAESGGIEKNNLCPRSVDHAVNAVARGLRYRAGNGDFLPHQLIDERRLTHVGAADHRDKARAEGDIGLTGLCFTGGCRGRQ